jgi:hypothetical protein
MECPAFQDQAGEVLHADANPVGLLLRQPSRTCSTKEIGFHLPSLSQATFQLYHYGALTFDPYDSFDGGAKMEQAGANRQ